MNLYVGNLPFDISETDLTDLFGQHGSVGKTSIIMDKMTGRSRGFGFVEMPNDGEAAAAITALHGKDYNGRALTVNEAKPRAPMGGGGRGGRGGGDRGYDR